MEHPLLVLDDCHVETVAVLSYLAKYMNKGDYIVIEDLHPASLDDYPFMGGQAKMIKETGNDKEPTMYDFLKLNGEWRVDNYFAGYFGQYSSTNGHGYLVKTE